MSMKKSLTKNGYEIFLDSILHIKILANSLVSKHFKDFIDEHLAEN